MFIGEAPGKDGAGLTGIPFYADPTGDNFEMLLAHIGLKREEVFITNAVLCNPLDEKGNNSPPTDTELRNCARWLKKTIELVKPEVVVTLGKAALTAIKRLESHNIELKDGIAKPVMWLNRILIPLYHPSPRVVNTFRSLVQQKKDWSEIRKILDRYEW
jgi:DNA polymerase